VTLLYMTIHVNELESIQNNYLYSRHLLTVYLPKNTDDKACAALLADEEINVAGEFALDNLR
jgi:hypothetical protein